jgi:hypothetical protein
MNRLTEESSLMVPTARLDDFAYHPSIIKMDVEGGRIPRPARCSSPDRIRETGTIHRPTRARAIRGGDGPVA